MAAGSHIWPGAVAAAWRRRSGPLQCRADDKGDERIFSFEVPSISSVCFLLSLI